MRGVSALQFTLMLVGSLPWSASAQAPDAEAELRRQFEHATELYEAQAYARAEAEFREVWRRMQGHPRRAMVLVNIGRCVEAQVGREAEALRIYEQMIAETNALAATDEAVHEARGLAEARIAELRARLAARAEGPAASGSESISPVGPIVIGLGGAMLIVGTITGGLALAQHEELLARCEGTRCPPDAAADAASIEPLAITSDVMLFGGAAVAAVGLVLLFVLHEGNLEPSASAACGPSGCIAVLRGSFE